MGLSSSKHSPSGVSSSSAPGAVVQRNRSIRSRRLASSCLWLRRSGQDETSLSDSPSENNGKRVSCSSEIKEGSLQDVAECYSVDKAEQTAHTKCAISGKVFKPYGESSFSSSVAGEAINSRPLSPHDPLPSSCSFYPGNASFRRTRANSLDSSNPTSTNVTISNDKEDCVAPSVSTVHRIMASQGCDFFPTCFPDRPSRMCDAHHPPNSLLNCPTPDYADDLQDNHGVNSINGDSETTECTWSSFLTSNDVILDGSGTRFSNRQIFPQEQVESSTRFRRTLSVGRLRNRVLLRTPSRDSDLYHFQAQGEVTLPRQVTRIQYLDDALGEATPGENEVSLLVPSGNGLSSMPIPFHGNPNPREPPRYRDLIEHRSNFYERRRRIRSQVRALQQLGRRSGSLPDHESSCILSGQYIAGRCSCHITAREPDSNDNASARASISRIATLAEALFEVLDEIHQQSVALSSRHSASSTASIPAPYEVVDSLPLKRFSNFKKKLSDEAAQCYICLVEYEEGDSMRILPCHHEFHQACVDKWLREIHRVCPLCRGDVCMSDSIKG